MAEEQRPIDPNDPTLVSSPEQLVEMKKGRLLGIRRMNGVVTVGLLIFCLAALGVWFASSGNHLNKKEDETISGNADATPEFANEVLKNNPTAGIMVSQPSNVPHIEGNGIATASASPEEIDRPVPPPVVQTPPVTAPVEEYAPQPSEEEMRDQQMAQQILQERYSHFTEAVKAQTGVQVDDSMMRDVSSASGRPRTPLSGTISQMEALRGDYERKLADARSRLDAVSNTPVPDYSYGADTSNLLGGGNTSTNSLAREPNADGWALHSDLVPPKPYEVTTGFVIPATMITGINSDLAGSIQAQVSQNVYDTATGKYLLIPQGTKIYGVYSNNVAFGQSRVLVAWNRLIYPDGRKLDIGNMGGATPAGYSGFEDKVNNHYFRLFGSAFLMSAITGGITWSQESNRNTNSDRTTASDAMSEALGQQLGQVTAQLIGKHLNVSPTIEIRPGYRFNVIVTKDISFNQPYQEFGY